jgi:secreted Zn-dependent insulinase-like peptidase
LKLKPIKIEDLPPIRTIALDEGHSFLLERELEDKTNENSCIITYYELGLNGEDQKLYLTNLIIMQFLSEPFFNDLRT